MLSCLIKTKQLVLFLIVFQFFMIFFQIINDIYKKLTKSCKKNKMLKIIKTYEKLEKLMIFKNLEKIKSIDIFLVIRRKHIELLNQGSTLASLEILV